MEGFGVVGSAESGFNRVGAVRVDGDGVGVDGCCPAAIHAGLEAEAEVAGEGDGCCPVVEGGVAGEVAGRCGGASAAAADREDGVPADIGLAA